MKNRRLINFGLLCVSAGIVLLIASLLLGAKGIWIDNFFNVKSELQEYTYDNMDMEAFDSIDVEVSNCAIYIMPSEDGGYGVQASLSVKDIEDVKLEVEGNTLVIERDSPNRFFWFSMDLGIDDTEQYVKIYLPEKEYANIVLDTSNDVVKISDVTADKLKAITSNASIILDNVSSEYIEADTSNAGVTAENVFGVEGKIITSNGGITLTTVHFEDKLRADTSNSNIVLNSVEADKLEVDSSNGKVSGNDVYGVECIIDTSNGDVEIDNIFFEDELKIESSNGKIDVLLDGSVENFKIDADTSNDDIYVDGNEVGDKYKGGKGDAVVELDTSNDTIVVEFK